MAKAGAARPLAERRILLGVTGGIAAYKSVFLLRLLREAGADVQVVMTPAATRFVGPETFAALSQRPVHSDVFERTDEVLHVRLGHEADVAVVAPATANVLGRLANGLADDLLTSVLLEATCPVVLAPAMHAGMWEHPATQANVRLLVDRGAVIVGPEEGSLAAGDEGVGRLAEPEEILSAVVGVVGPTGDFQRQRILVTAGPTFEPIDAVRFVGNRSSGKMGWAVAVEAARRGAAVTLVSGPVGMKDPAGVEVVRVETAKEMEEAVLSRYPGVDAVVMAAAVSDWRPSRPTSQKLKKDHGPPSLVLEPTTDILSTLGKKKERQVLVGFAAETNDLESEGRRKLMEKNVDFIVVNVVGTADSGFTSETDFAAILSREHDDVAPRMWNKAELAAAICDRLVSLLRGQTRHI